MRYVTKFLIRIGILKELVVKDYSRKATRMPPIRFVPTYQVKANLARKENERKRIARLIKYQSMKFWDINGTKIFALNQKNAWRKYQNLMAKQ